MRKHIQTVEERTDELLELMTSKRKLEFAFTIFNRKLDIFLQPNNRAHWAVRQRGSKASKEQGYFKTIEALQAFGLDPAEFTKENVPLIRLHCIRFFKGQRMDDDNLSPGFKALIDGIALGLGRDDKDFRMSFEQIKAECGPALSFNISVVSEKEKEGKGK